MEFDIQKLFEKRLAISAPVANYTTERMATRFSDVMWLIEQIMWKSLDKRIAAFCWRKLPLKELTG